MKNEVRNVIRYTNIIAKKVKTDTKILVLIHFRRRKMF